MAVIFVCSVYTKGLERIQWNCNWRHNRIRHIVFMAFISGASMNPARAFAPALVSG